MKRTNETPPEDDPAEHPEPRGIECRRCGCRHFFVRYTRPTIMGRILRRRECRNCGARVTTYEGQSQPA